MSDQATTEKSIYKKFSALPRKEKQYILELVQILADDRNDVYFVVCENGAIVYQGYAVHTAMKSYSTVTSVFIEEAQSSKPTSSNAFGFVYPDNTTSIVDTFGGDE